MTSHEVTRNEAIKKIQLKESDNAAIIQTQLQKKDYWNLYVMVEGKRAGAGISMKPFTMLWMIFFLFKQADACMRMEPSDSQS